MTNQTNPVSTIKEAIVAALNEWKLSNPDTPIEALLAESRDFVGQLVDESFDEWEEYNVE